MKYALVGLVILALIGTTLPFHPKKQPIPDHVEFKAKQAILQRDTQMTQQLNLDQALLRLKRESNILEGVKNQAAIQTHLNQLIQNHSHLDWVQYIPNKSNGSKLIAGTKQGHHPHQLWVKTADTATKAGKRYISPAYPDGNGITHRIIGVPSSGAELSLIAEITFHVANEVKKHQMKNLRLEVFPNEKKHGMKIKTVNPNTLKEQKVDSPEENEGKSHYRKNEVVVKFRTNPTQLQINQMERDIQGKMNKKMGPVYIFQSKKLTTKQLMAYFRKHHVVYVEPHYLYNTNEENSATIVPKDMPVKALGWRPTMPNDLLYSEYQWNLPLIKTENGWSINKGNKQVIIAVVDTGVDINHPEFKGKLLKGMNFIDPSQPPMDDVGHGTHVTGIIGALTNNNEGVAGITWYNKILPIKVLDSSGSGSTYDVAQGIIWAADHGASVINLSLGNYAKAEFLHDAVKYAYNKGVVLIAASGNDNTGKLGYPAAYPEVLAVSATDKNLKRAPFSNYGAYVDVVAPGVNIASTYPDNQYAALSGTSMASPHVSALAGLIRSVNPKLSNEQVMGIIKQTATDLGPKGKDPYFGYGEIQINRALMKANPISPSVVPLSEWAVHQIEAIRSKVWNTWSKKLTLNKRSS